ncbi:hydrogenase expression/formation protein HypE [Desulfoplanes formicivorans]|uniref:Hydrogenase expression/formation protein HypE n=1 Tax=Desulfoplanes formicivorans TaxID=1592317 RepID=A0A194AG51_9BACT|nr:hydrogenase expression/formation protein HypE [Desulfoplanes formicivorans]GAU09057.1 hydrogenase expression/formation protein HypE [Desulfoplanes formicivorans]
MSQKLLLDYGSGGKASQRLISGMFLKYLGNDRLNRLDDAAFLELSGPISMSTDTFTVDPLFFPGGDIGSLAVHGTVNDVAMLGARPRFITCGLILEEGLDMDVLERIIASVGRAARNAGVEVVTGDTKVVPRGAADKIFINTTGVGEIFVTPGPSGHSAKPGDAILISGTMGDHGLTILSKREGLSFDAPVESDSAALNHLIVRLLQEIPEIHVLRDPTRGGLATTLSEIALQSNVECFIREKDIPVREAVAGGCSFLGLDPLYLANEGKFICILPEKFADKALEIMRSDVLATNAQQIGEVRKDHPGKVVLETPIGGHRLLDMLEGAQLPRIC